MNANKIKAGIQATVKGHGLRYVQNPDTDKIDCYINRNDGMGWKLWEQGWEVEEAIDTAVEEAPDSEWEPVTEWD